MEDSNKSSENVLEKKMQMKFEQETLITFSLLFKASLISFSNIKKLIKISKRRPYWFSKNFFFWNSPPGSQFSLEIWKILQLLLKLENPLNMFLKLHIRSCSTSHHAIFVWKIHLNSQIYKQLLLYKMKNHSKVSNFLTERFSND